jgi:hypothetical protein
MNDIIAKWISKIEYSYSKDNKRDEWICPVNALKMFCQSSLISQDEQRIVLVNNLFETLRRISPRQIIFHDYTEFIDGKMFIDQLFPFLLEELSSFLKETTSIKTLECFNHRFTTERKISLINSLKENNSIQEISLIINNKEKNLIDALCSLIESNKLISYINILNLRISELELEYVKKIETALEKNHSIIEFDPIHRTINNNNNIESILERNRKEQQIKRNNWIILVSILSKL